MVIRSLRGASIGHTTGKITSGGLELATWIVNVEGGRKPFYDVLMATERECCDCT